MLLFSLKLEKIAPSGARTYFMKKKIFLLFFHLNQDVKRWFFHIFSYFRDLFFKFDAYQLYELSFVHILAVTRIKFTSYVRIKHLLKKIFFKTFTHTETSKLSFSFFSRISETFFQICFSLNWITLFCTSFGCNYKRYIYIL